jgi:hypothetical protein
MAAVRLLCMQVSVMPGAARHKQAAAPSGILMHRWETGKKYIAVVCCFAGFLYCNVKALQASSLIALRLLLLW